MENAFNTLDRGEMLAAVRQHVPQMLPVMQWAYGEATTLHVLGAPPGTTIESQRGTKQGNVEAGLLLP